MTTRSHEERTFIEPPNPDAASNLKELISLLRLLKKWAGDPSYATITKRVNALWKTGNRPQPDWTYKNTVAACFRLDRRRIDDDLFLAIIEVLNPRLEYVKAWHEALRRVRGEAAAASFVRAQSTLPEDIANFTGRQAELDRIVGLSNSLTTTAVVSAIEGMAGIGKTQLAIHAAHYLMKRGRFERVLFVNLRGFHTDKSQPPADPAAVLAEFLRHLGVASEDIPHDLAGRVQMYREKLRRQRALVVLDNAANENQVEPLICDSPTCMNLITTRRSLQNMPSALYISLDVFDPDEALDFLRRRAGASRIDGNLETSRRICEAAGYLPLALELTAARVNAHPDWSLSDHLVRLTTRRQELRLDDDLELAFQLSYEDLEEQHRQTIRRLVLQPGPDMDVYSIASLISASVENAGAEIERLVADHFVRRSSKGRYELHDLVHAYITARCHDEDAHSDRLAAITRLLEHYLHCAARAAELLYPYEPVEWQATTSTPAPNLTTQDAARAWLELERVNVMAAASYAAREGLHQYTRGFLDALHRYLETAGRFDDSLAMARYALQSAESTGDLKTQAVALNWTGVTYFRQGRYTAAATFLRHALENYRRLGDHKAEGRVLNNLGGIQMRLGNVEEALTLDRQALEAHRATGDLLGEGHTLNNIGFRYIRTDRHREAIPSLLRALEIFRGLEDENDESITLGNLGVAYHKMGELGQALDYLRSSLTICENADDKPGQADVLKDLAAVHNSLGDDAEAIDHAKRAIAISRGINDLVIEAESLNQLGEILRDLGRFAEAILYYREALDVANKIENREEQARAHAGFGYALEAEGDATRAIGHYQAAMELYEAVGYPQARDVARRIARLSGN